MEYNKVIQGNSDIILKQFLDEGVKFDLICTDPPYNLNKDFGNDSDRLGLDEFLKVTEQRIDLCKELLTPNGSIVWFGIHLLQMLTGSCLPESVYFHHSSLR